MNEKKSSSNPKKKTRISKTLIISEHPFGKKQKLKGKITKINNELNNMSRYNTLNVNETSKQDNEQNEILNDFEIDKIKPKNLSKFKFNNNTIVLDTKKYIKLNDKNKNNVKYNRSNINNTQLINGGNHKNNHEKINLKITLNNRNPIKLRKINTNINKNYLMEDNNPLFEDKNLETINSLSTINLKENKISKSKKDDETINQLKEEIEKLKEENANDDNIINDLKNQLNENNDDIISEDSEDTDTNEEINIDQNFINSIEENNIFNKLRANYMYNKILINQLTNQNSELKIKIINKSNNIIRRGNSDENESNNIYKIQKESAFNICHNDNIIKNNDSDNTKNSILNNMIEKKLKSNQRDSFMMKRLNEDIDDKIKLMLKMIINVNNIGKDEIINLFMNNLLDYYKTVEVFASKYLKISNAPDIKILKNYFKSIFFDSEKKFNVNNAFNEILSFFDNDIKKLEDINILEIYNNHKILIENILKRCKVKDFLDTGLIEFTVFKNIYNEFQDKKEFVQTDRENLLNILIFNMKKNDENNEQIGLFFLSYQNLCNAFNLNDILKNNNENEKSSNTKSKKKKK